MSRQMILSDDFQGTGANSVFARHETFHPRFGWLKKGFDALRKDRHVFLRDDAPVILGVGKNMVRSIRYWCEAFKVTQGDQPTDWGHQIFDQWDNYLEDIASLWLLHWYLLKPPCSATAWWISFNYFRQTEFTADILLEALSNYCTNLNRTIAESSLRKDITCLLRMYTTQNATNSLTEDTIDSPFAQLYLIKSAEDNKHFFFNMGFKDNLPAEVIVFACLDYVSSFMGDKQQGTVSISRLLYEPNSPGMVFKLSEVALCEAIEAVARTQPSIHLSDNAGLIQLTFSDFPGVLSGYIMKSYYARYL